MFLGIDVGTQSVKALLYDAHKRRVTDIQSAPLDLISRADGSREQLAPWWLAGLQACLAGFSTKDKASVKALAVSGQQHGFVPVAADGAVLAPVKLWCDTATVAECDEITARFGGQERCLAEVGNAILPGYTASKILWLKKHRPRDYAQLASIMLPHDYLNFYLTGEKVMEVGDASGTGMLDIRRRDWHTGMLAAIDGDRELSRLLPPLVASGTAIGQLRKSVAATLGLAAGIPVASGGGDNMMAAIGTGNVSTGRMTVSLGTSGTLFASTDQPVLDARGTLAAFCSSTGGWLPLLCTMNCTVSTELTRRLLSMDIATFEAAVAAAPVGADGVMTLPFFNGERTPNLPQGKGCILGLDESNYSRQNLARSAMESSVYSLRLGFDSFREQGCDVSTLRVTGGGAGSATWRQMVADIFNLPVSVQVVDEGAALGAALQALGMLEADLGTPSLFQALLDSHLALDIERSCEPHPESALAYREYFEQYQRHVGAISPLYADSTQRD